MLKWKIKECQLYRESLIERSESVFGLWINCGEWRENPRLMERQKASQIKKDEVSESPSKRSDKGIGISFHPADPQGKKGQYFMPFLQVSLSQG